MMLESDIDRHLAKQLKNHSEGQATLDLLVRDVEVTALNKQASYGDYCLKWELSDKDRFCTPFIYNGS